MASLARPFGVTALVLAAWAAFGCQSIIGIEDKTLTDSCDEKCVACQDYCAAAMANCTGENAVYRTDEACLGLCNSLPLGVIEEPGNENTVACRLEQAIRAGESEPNLYCNGAGPGGGNLCGSDCESFCYLLETVCPGTYDLNNLESTDECLDKCRALRDEPNFDVNAYYDTDTVECRIIHLANATNDPSHCGHGDFKSTDHCFPPPSEDPDCNEFCRMAMGVCKDENQVYDDAATCVATCQALPLGSNTDRIENTVGCRHYHTFNSVPSPEIHCSHTGPTGAGHCGELEDGIGNCESYCILAKAGCETQYAATFTSDEACREACAVIPGVADDRATDGVNETEQYSLALATSGEAGMAFQCRVLHATRAIRQGGEPIAECSAVFGEVGSACP
jgi:hypothetical protein